MSGRRKTVKEILVEKQLVNEEQLNQALAEGKKTNQPLEQAVARLGFIDRLALLKTLSTEWGVKSMDLEAIEIDPEIVKIIPESLARRHRAVPFAKEENYLFVAMADPKDLFAVEDIQLKTNRSVQVFLALPDDISKCLDKAYIVEEAAPLPEEDEQQQSPEPVDMAATAAEAKELTEELLSSISVDGEVQVDKSETAETVDIMQVATAAPEVEKLMNAIILEAIRLKASDIHVEPMEKRLAVRYRVDGNLRRSTFKIPMTFKQALIAKIKIMTGSMDITERRIPQDGRIQVKAKGRPIEFRVNIVPTVYGESAVMRILDRAGSSAKLEDLGFLPDTKEKLLESLNKPYGLILVCGPTGSGKSYTLSAALAAIKDPAAKILTAENPVEYNLDGVIQVQVNPELKMGDKVFDFAMALRAFLRQDPDIIMVGEIRDRETGQIAMEAAMTGHMVLSTLHTNDAPQAISRLSEMGVPSFLVANTTEAILAQRLIRTLCKNCKEPDADPPEDLLKMLTENKIDYSKAIFMKPHQGGCPKCGGSGMKGRTAIHELLIMDDELRRFCIKEVSVGPIRDLAVKHGMRLLVQDGLIKITMGLTTLEELMATAQ